VPTHGHAFAIIDIHLAAIGLDEEGLVGFGALGGRWFGCVFLGEGGVFMHGGS
jgi:hypothetical protein